MSPVPFGDRPKNGVGDLGCNAFGDLDLPRDAHTVGELDRNLEPVRDPNPLSEA